MHISIISIFPELFTNFIENSLIQKARENGIIEITPINPRSFCEDKHKQIDDEIYGGGAGMLIKAEPIIKAIQHSIEQQKEKKFMILFPSPSEIIFNQKIAHQYIKHEHLIFICGRYEGIDHRVEQYCLKHYPDQRNKISLGKFITLGGETPTMVIIEAITRLIPKVIGKSESREDESYNIMQEMNNIEYPQYTRPKEVYGFKVPEILLSGNHKKIQARKDQQSKKI